MVDDRSLQLAAAGDVTAFEEIYRFHYRRVYNQCLRMTRSVFEAEDLTQDVFIQLYRKLKSFRGESAFTTWLHRLTINVVLMHFRRTAVNPLGKKNHLSDPIEHENQIAVSETTSIVDRISIQDAIQQLAPGYRVVLVLHDIEGYEHEQISTILGCAVGTSKSQLHKARKKLRDLLRKGPPRRPRQHPSGRELNALMLNKHALATP